MTTKLTNQQFTHDEHVRAIDIYTQQLERQFPLTKTNKTEWHEFATKLQMISYSILNKEKQFKQKMAQANLSIAPTTEIGSPTIIQFPKTPARNYEE